MKNRISHKTQTFHPDSETFSKWPFAKCFGIGVKSLYRNGYTIKRTTRLCTGCARREGGGGLLISHHQSSYCKMMTGTRGEEKRASLYQQPKNHHAAIAHLLQNSKVRAIASCIGKRSLSCMFARVQQPFSDSGKAAAQGTFLQSFSDG